MPDQQQFLDALSKGYTFKGESMIIGAAMLGGEVIEGAQVKLPLKTFNRHGLIAGATGTGKTKTLQVISEALSNASVPVLLMDIKGDLSGIAAPGTSNPILEERMKKIGIPFTPAKMPVDLLTLSSQPGVRLRATVLEFGPILVSKILGLNDTQEGVVSMIFKYCYYNKLPLVDLNVFIRVLHFVSN